jgi:hypothetical protein
MSHVDFTAHHLTQKDSLGVPVLVAREFRIKTQLILKLEKAIWQNTKKRGKLAQQRKHRKQAYQKK